MANHMHGKHPGHAVLLFVSQMTTDGNCLRMGRCDNCQLTSVNPLLEILDPPLVGMEKHRWGPSRGGGSNEKMGGGAHVATTLYQLVFKLLRRSKEGLYHDESQSKSQFFR